MGIKVIGTNMSSSDVKAKVPDDRYVSTETFNKTIGEIDNQMDDIKSDIEDINELIEEIDVSTANLANLFSADNSYSTGDYVIYNDILYKFITNHNGAWSDSDVEAVKTCDEIKVIESSVETLNGQAVRSCLSGNITPGNYTNFWTDANNQPENTVYFYLSTLTEQMVANLPTYDSALWLACIDSTTADYGQVQIAITGGSTNAGRRMWFRSKMSADTWRPWMKLCTEYTLGNVVAKYQESDMAATRNYNAGTLIFVDGVLYKATTSISNGATLTVGTNVAKTTIAEELSALNS